MLSQRTNLKTSLILWQKNNEESEPLNLRSMSVVCSQSEHMIRGQALSKLNLFFEKTLFFLAFSYLLVPPSWPAVILVDHLGSRLCVPFKLPRLNFHISTARLENNQLG